MLTLVRTNFDWKCTMSSLQVSSLKVSSLTIKLVILAAGLMLSGCMEATNYEPTNQANFKPHDKELLAKVRYEKVDVPEAFRRAIVDYHRKEAPGSILVDSDNHYLYFVLNDGKAIRYGVTVGEEAMAWSGIAKIGSMTEWPAWHPTKGEIERLGVPTFVARALSLLRRQGHAVPDSRHQPARIYRLVDLLRLHPDDQ
jgi:lipoprotein-anchoring transpeptidase ErfK/SrfK